MSYQDKVKVTNSKNLPNIQIQEFHNNLYTGHGAHLLKLLDKICKYEMDLAYIMEDTGQYIRNFIILL